MSTLADMVSKGQIVFCSRCGGILAWSYDVIKDGYGIAPCRECQSNLERGAVCTKCWGPVSFQYNANSNKTEVVPCPRCFQEAEHGAVKAAAEELGSLRRGVDDASMKGYKTGYRAGWKDAMDYCDSQQ